MSTYPGETPQEPDDQHGEGVQDDPVEHTAPITPAEPGPVFNPTSALPGPGWTQPGGQPPAAPPPSYGQSYGSQYPTYGQPGPAPNAYGQPGQGQPQYGQPQYGQPQYGQPQYGQPQYGQPPYPPQPPPGYGPYGTFRPPAPKHPQSTTAMVLGIVGLVGVFLVCGLTLFLSPFAWALGRNALKEIEGSQGQLGGESQARAGMITGIIGTVLLFLAVVAIILFVILAIAGSSGDFSTGTNA